MLKSGIDPNRFRALSIMLIEIKKSVIYMAKGDRG